MPLVIVESPTKSKTLQGFLGPKYRVLSSYGHMRDLPKNELGIDLENDFKPKYIIIPRVKKNVELLKKEVKKAELVILGVDEDREGESIAWHLTQILNLNGQKPYQRIVFHEITKSAIKEALKNPRDIDLNLVDAQQARRVLDRIVGYKLSPFLWKKVARGLSAGRVQSAAVRLVAEREREIEAFLAQEYWTIVANLEKIIKTRLSAKRTSSSRASAKGREEDLSSSNSSSPSLSRAIAKGSKNTLCSFLPSSHKRDSVEEESLLSLPSLCESSVFEALLTKKNGKVLDKLAIKNKKEAEKIIKDLKNAEYKVTAVEKKETKKNPLPPFTTSTLQQTTWQKFHWPAKMTMRLAQNLYERGLCVDENSLIIAENGEIYKIKELKNLFSRKLVGLNEKSLQTEFADVSKFWKVPAPKKMLKIETEDHEKVLITKDHPLLLLRNGIPMWVKGKNIKEGDFVAAVESIDVNRKKSSLNILELIDYFPQNIQKRVEFQFAVPFFSLIRRKTTGKPVPYSLLKNQLGRKRLDIETIKKYYLGVRIKPPVGRANFHQIPFNLTPEIAYLTGFIAGDGHLPKDDPKIRLFQKPANETECFLLNNIVEGILGTPFNKFSVAKKNAQHTINSTFFYQLVQIFGIQTGKKTEIVDISNILLSQPNEIIKAYLAGLWDSDGCINKHPSANSLQISYSSKSEILIDKLRLVLKTFGINSSKHLDKRTNVFWIRLTASGIPKFKTEIGPNLIIKKTRLEKLYKKYSMLYETRVISQCQKVPGIMSVVENIIREHNVSKQRLSNYVGVDVFNYFGKVDSGHTRLPFIQKTILEKISRFADTENQLFKNLAISSVIWKKIQKVKNINYKKSWVYDVTTSTNTFIVNGMVSHNCTYHRTDSLNLSNQSLFSAKKFIIKNYGEKYWPGFLRKYKTKTKGAQEAHEAIRPTYPDKTPDKLKLDSQQTKLYNLIWRRFISSQMVQAIFDSTTVDIEAKNYIFRATGQILKFDGFLKVYPLKYEENELPALEKNEILELIKLIPSQHFTQPLPRYNEATLIKALEENGIGRPSTYAPILSNIQEKNYIEKDEQKRFRPTEIGLVVNDLLETHFPEIVDIGFTAKMEENLDKIAEGQKKWTGIVKDFYQPFEKNLKQKYEEVSKKDITEKPTEKTCPKCQAPLLIRLGKYGKFYACSRFPKCRYTESLEENVLGIKCPKCKKGEIIEKRTKKRKIFYGCNQFPKCDFALWDKPTGEKCPKCGSLLIKTKRGQIKCSNTESRRGEVKDDFRKKSSHKEKECDYKVEK